MPATFSRRNWLDQLAHQLPTRSYPSTRPFSPRTFLAQIAEELPVCSQPSARPFSPRTFLAQIAEELPVYSHPRTHPFSRAQQLRKTSPPQAGDSPSTVADNPRPSRAQMLPAKIERLNDLRITTSVN